MRQLPPVRGIYWASIFTHRDALYRMGHNRNYGHAVIVPCDRSEEPGKTRNTLALISSPDLNNWNVNCIVMHNPDVEKPAFQYRGLDC